MLFLEDVVFRLSSAMDGMAVVRRRVHQPLRELLGKEDLSYMRSMTFDVGHLFVRTFPRDGLAAQSHLEVNMVGAADIEAWKDGRKGYAPSGIGELNTPQKGQFIRRPHCWRRPHALGRRGTVAGVLWIESGSGARRMLPVRT